MAIQTCLAILQFYGNQGKKLLLLILSEYRFLQKVVAELSWLFNCLWNFLLRLTLSAVSCDNQVVSTLLKTLSFTKVTSTLSWNVIFPEKVI